MPLFDYRCEIGHTSELIRPGSVYRVPCDACGGPADRIISGHVAIVGPTTDTRGMYRRFTEASAELNHAGADTVAPSLWGAAKQQAAAMVQAGEAPAIRKE